jgi:septum formation protein
VKLILASSSPRRRQLLDLLGLPFEVDPSEIDEIARVGEAPSAFALRAAREKASDVANRHPGRLVLGSDTVVELDGRILGKPSDGEDAFQMLRSLSGRTHQVHTAVSLVRDEKAHHLIDTSTVEFNEIGDERIRWYVETGEPLDKAGAYAIQGIAGVLVARLDGSPHTVVGLPIHRLPDLFAAHGVDFWSLLVKS